MNNKKKLLLGLPKGSLEEKTISLFQKAGFNISLSSRSYTPQVDDDELEIRLLRAQEISIYVEHGPLDAGITGYDWIVNNGSNVIEVCELQYARQGFGKVKWVVAVPEEIEVKDLSWLNGKRIATEAVGLAKRFLKEYNIEAEVEFSWGATEVKVPELADAIIELTETGSSLRANKLKVIHVIMESTTRFIASHKAYTDGWKRRKIDQIATLLKGALAAEAKVLLKMNVSKTNLSRIISILPALHAPTVSPLGDDDWFAVETVVDESVVRELIPRLKENGAQGIIELSLNKIVP